MLRNIIVAVVAVVLAVAAFGIQVAITNQEPYVGAQDLVYLFPFIALVEIFVNTIAGACIRKSIPWIILLLCGLLITGTNWSAGLCLGIIVAVLLLEPKLGKGKQ